MEYSKLLIVLCLFIAISKAVPLPPADPVEFLEEAEKEAPADLPVPPELPELPELPADLPAEAPADLPVPPLPADLPVPPEGPVELPEEPTELPELPADLPVPPLPAEAPIEVSTDGPVEEEQDDEPIFIDPEADQEPQDISTDTNGVVADNIGNITNDILGGVSYAIKTAIEKELGTETNDSATNGIVNDVVVDILTKTSDEIKTAVDTILENDMENTDSQTIAAETAGKIAAVLGDNVVTSIAENININLDYENVANNVISNTVENVEDFVKKSIDTSKAVVEETLTNESSDDIAISNANDIATMTTNGVSYLIKSTLCEGSENAETCENIANSIIVNSAGILNEIVSSNIKAVEEGNGLNIACSTIPGDVFEKLTAVVVDAVSAQLGESADGDSVGKIVNNILTLIINSIEDLLCANRTDASEEGSVILKDITGLATHIINKVNNINDNVVETLNEEKEEDNTTISGTISTGITDIQDTIKEAEGGEAPKPEEPVEAEQPVEQPIEAEQPAEEPVEAEQADVEDAE